VADAQAFVFALKQSHILFLLPDLHRQISLLRYVQQVSSTPRTVLIEAGNNQKETIQLISPPRVIVLHPTMTYVSHGRHQKNRSNQTQKYRKSRKIPTICELSLARMDQTLCSLFLVQDQVMKNRKATIWKKRKRHQRTKLNRVLFSQLLVCEASIHVIGDTGMKEASRRMITEIEKFEG
jgi:hypothetical protein